MSLDAVQPSVLASSDHSSCVKKVALLSCALLAIALGTLIAFRTPVSLFGRISRYYALPPLSLGTIALATLTAWECSKSSNPRPLTQEETWFQAEQIACHELRIVGLDDKLTAIYGEKHPLFESDDLKLQIKMATLDDAEVISMTFQELQTLPESAQKQYLTRLAAYDQSHPPQKATGTDTRFQSVGEIRQTQGRVLFGISDDALFLKLFTPEQINDVFQTLSAIGRENNYLQQLLLKFLPTDDMQAIQNILRAFEPAVITLISPVLSSNQICMLDESQIPHIYWDKINITTLHDLTQEMDFEAFYAKVSDAGKRRLDEIKNTTSNDAPNSHSPVESDTQ